MNSSLKTLLILCVFTVAISLAGCKEDVVPVGLRVHDHYPKRQVLGASVNGEASAPVGGTICCVTIPRKWKPGLTAEVSWSVYLEEDSNDPRNPNKTEKLVRKSAVVEIPEYMEAEGFHVHVYPDDKVRIAMTNKDIGNPFYPLPKAEWPPYEVDRVLIWRYLNVPNYYAHKPRTRLDIEWIKQWGVADGKCTDPEYLAWEKEYEVKIQQIKQSEHMQQEQKNLQPQQSQPREQTK